MPNFSIALTGLEADTVSLNTIGNNLANLNTTAYKDQTTQFQDLFYQQVGVSGSGNELQVGVGTRVSSTATSFQQGSLTTTQNATDLALSGDGFFVVNKGGVQALTRAGNFQLNASGNLITNDGAQVQGYAATGGKITAGGSLTGLNVPVGTTEAAQATGSFSLTANLNSGATAGTQFSTPLTIFDSLGQSHVATVSFQKSSANQWGYSVALPSGDATGATANTTGTLTFDGSGNLVTPAGNVSGISFAGLSDGASDLNFNWNLYGANGAATITQAASASTATTTLQDGFASGAYKGFTVGADGVIAAQYSNGQTTNVGQVAVASVANEQGLTRAGGNNFVTTAASGASVAGVAGVGGRGTIQDDSLESSNVDIASEFSNLIVAQRAFEANSKTITTFDTVTQAAIQLIR